MANGIEALANLTGLPESEVQRIADEVRANLARLNACGAHTFVRIEPAPPTRPKYRCEACGGAVDHHAYRWYALGLEHARGGAQS
ncbi:hypothetical protein PQR05_29520 [Paraburkholderia sediminicola]|uniref:hypothetical protein n=1 Tax=Paraburkholderia sediminicola TaxID=458836 RepID=UPI0038B91D1B